MSDQNVYKAVYVISEGPIEGPSSTLIKSIYANDVAIQDANGTMNFEGASIAYRSGLPTQTAIPGITYTATPVAVNLPVTNANPVEVTVAGQYDGVNVTVFFEQGLYRINDNGEQKGEDAVYHIDVKSNGSGLWVPVYRENLHYQKLISPFEKSYHIPLPPGGSPWIIRVVRDSFDTTNPNIINDFTFRRYETLVNGKFSYPNVAHLAVELGAKQFNNTIPKISGKFKGIQMWVPKNYNPVTRTYATSGEGTSGGIWDGTFKLAYTNNPCWIYFDIICNNRYGLGLEINPNNDVVNALADKWNLYVISQYCDEMINDGYGGTEPRFTFNAYINAKAAAYDFLQMIVASFRGMLYFSSNQMFVTADIPDTISQIFTQADVEDGLFTYAGSPLKTRSSVVYVKWRNPNNQFKEEVEVYQDFDAIYEFGYREKTIQGIGITSRGLARRLAKWMLLSEKKQTQTVAFTTGFKGGRLFPGKLIKIMDSYKSGVRYGGKFISVLSDPAYAEFVLDAPVTLDSGVAYTLSMITPMNTVISRPVTTAAGTTNTIRTDPIGGDGSSVPLENATWMLTSTNLDGAQYRVVSVKDKNNGKYEVAAVQHYPNKYAEIEDGPSFEDYPTAIYNNTQLQAPAALTVNQWYEDVQGAQSNARITASWTPVPDNRVVRYELQFRTATTPYATVYVGNDSTWDSERLTITTDSIYRLRVRAVSALGSYSDWAYSTELDMVGKDTIPLAPTNFTATGIINGINLNWDNPVLSDFRYVNVYKNSVNNSGTATIVAKISDDFYTEENLTPGVTSYYWLQTVTSAATNNQSALTAVQSAIPKQVLAGDIASGAIDVTKFASGIEPVALVTALPSPVGYTGPKTVYNTTDNQLYSYTGTEFVPAVGTIEDGSITIAKFAAGIRPVEIVSSFPTTGNVQGRTVFLTTDNKLYRYNGSAFVATVPTTDLTGQVIASQIQDGAIGIAKVAAGFNMPLIVNKSNINDGTVTAAVAGALAYNVFDGKMYRNTNGSLPSTSWAVIVQAAGDITGQLTSGQIQDGAINIAKFAAGIAPVEIVATLPSTGNYEGRQAFLTTDDKLYRYTGSAWIKTVDGNDIAANSIIAGKIAAGAISATEIAANAITATKLAVVSNSLSKDPFFEDLNMWTVSPGTVSPWNTAQSWFPEASSGTANTMGVKGCATIWSGSGTWVKTTQQLLYQAGSFNTWMPVRGSQTYSISAVAYNTSNQIGSIQIDWYTSTGTYISSSPGNVAAGSNLTQVNFQVIAPSNAAYARVVFYNASGSTFTGVIAFGNFTFREANAASMYVDGTINATKIVAASITTTQIAADTITANNIAANAITATELAANSVIAGKIAAGVITAAEIAAGAITTSKLAVITDAINRDPYIKDGTYWTNVGPAGNTSPSAGSASTVGWYLESNNGTVSNNVNAPSWATLHAPFLTTSLTARYHMYTAAGAANANTMETVQAGTTYAFSVGFWNSTNQWFTYNIEWYNGSFTFISGHSADIVPAATLVRRTLQATAPSGAAYCRFVFFNQSGTTLSGTCYVGGFFMRKANSAELYVDGTITASKLVANSITANEIAANAITASELAANSVVAGKIAAAAVSTTELAANAITASKLAVGDFTNVVGDGGMSDIVWWGQNALPAGSNVEDAPTDGGWPINTRWFRIAGLNQAFDVTTPKFATVPGATYRVEYRTWTNMGTFTGYYQPLIHNPSIAWHSMGHIGLPGVNPGVNDSTNAVVSALDTGNQSANITTHGTLGNFLQFRFIGQFTGTDRTVLQVKITRVTPSVLIMDGAITADKIVANAVTSDKIAANSIIAGKIAAGAVSTTELAAGAVTVGKIGANAVETVSIANGAITAAKISVTSLSAITATIGTLRTATSGARVEIMDNVIKVYDASGNLRVQLGDLSL